MNMVNNISNKQIWGLGELLLTTTITKMADWRLDKLVVGLIFYVMIVIIVLSLINNHNARVTLSYLGRVVQDCTSLLVSLKKCDVTLNFVKHFTNKIAHYIIRNSSSSAD